MSSAKTLKLITKSHGATPYAPETVTAIELPDDILTAWNMVEEAVAMARLNPSVTMMGVFYTGLLIVDMPFTGIVESYRQVTIETVLGYHPLY